MMQVKLYRKMYNADVLIFAAPIYFGGVSGALHTLLGCRYPLIQLKPQY